MIAPLAIRSGASSSHIRFARRCKRLPGWLAYSWTLLAWQFSWCLWTAC